jgi:hypothetical protein
MLALKSACQVVVRVDDGQIRLQRFFVPGRQPSRFQGQIADERQPVSVTGRWILRGQGHGGRNVQRIT